MSIVYGQDAREILCRAIDRSETTPVSGVFEYFDMGGAMYKAFKSIGGELFIKEYGTFNEAVRFVNMEV